MGGGNSGGWNRLGDISSLEEKAKKVLNQGAKRHVFISFDTDDMNEVNLLRGQAKSSTSNLEFKDFSVRAPINSKRAEYIKQKITERIERSSICVVYLSNVTRNSDWVKWEVDTCKKLGKTIIGTHKGNTPPKNMPSWVKDHKIDVVPWSGLSKKIDNT